MEHDFWHKKWQRKEIGFHEGRPNSLLVRHFSRLGLSQAQRIFLPLCGKTRDIDWLLKQGLQVAGAELNEKAIQELFEELSLSPKIEKKCQLLSYSADNIEIFVGDLFQLDATTLGPVNAAYDRAALVALPKALRIQYAKHLRELLDKAPQLQIVFEYDQEEMNGPPFSITEKEIEEHYLSSYKIEILEEKPVEGRLKGQVEAREIIRYLY